MQNVSENSENFISNQFQNLNFQLFKNSSMAQSFNDNFFNNYTVQSMFSSFEKSAIALKLLNQSKF